MQWTSFFSFNKQIKASGFIFVLHSPKEVQALVVFCVTYFFTVVASYGVSFLPGSVSNLIKNSVPVHLNSFSVHLIFFFNLSPEFFSGLWYKSERKYSWQTEKKSGVQDLKIFLRFETDLNFSRPWFSEMKVQIKWPMYWVSSWVVDLGSYLNSWFLNSAATLNISWIWTLLNWSWIDLELWKTIETDNNTI